MRVSKYNAALLEPIVKSSRTLGEVIRRLGLPATGGNYRHIAARLRQAGVDTSHLRSTTIQARCESIPKEALAALVAENSPVAQILTKLGLPTEGRPHRVISQRIRDLGVETKHLRGSGWSRGETKRSHPSVAQNSRKQTRSDDEVFVEHSPIVGGQRITPRLLTMGWSYACTWCGIAEWRDTALVLHLDHINGVNNDNRLVNLRLLCPNCHSQTETYGRKRRAHAVVL